MKKYVFGKKYTRRNTNDFATILFEGINKRLSLSRQRYQNSVYRNEILFNAPD